MDIGKRKIAAVHFAAPPFGPYDYFLPDELDYAAPGFRVTVPLGKREVYGVIGEIRNGDGDFKEVIDVPDITPFVPPQTWALIEFVARYYAASCGECIRMTVPRRPGDPGSDILFAGPGYQTAPETDETGDIIETVCLSGWLHTAKLSHAQKAAAVTAVKSGQLVVEPNAVKPDSANTLVELVAAQESGRAPKLLKLAETLSDAPLTLSDLAEQGFDGPYVKKAAAKGVIRISLGRNPVSSIDMQQGEHRVISLGGGSVEQRMNYVVETIGNALNEGGAALVIVPEIYRASPIISRLTQSGFSPVEYSSAKPAGERYSLFKNAAYGSQSLIVGTHSALFLPIPNLKLIVVFDDFNNAHKPRDRAPFYHSRETALMAAKPTGASVVFCGPAVSSEAANAVAEGRWERIHLGKPAALPQTTTINMPGVIKEQGAKTVLSREMIASVNTAVEKGDAALLLINRRGFIPVVYCGNCGYALRCTNCDANLVYHKARKALLCHYCGRSEPLPGRCPSCHKAALIGYGVGTETVEGEAKRLFPDYKIERVDGDTMSKASYRADFWKDFEKGRVDVIVGTDMALRAVYSRRVGMVGLVNADSALSYPDFRAAERTYQTIRLITENMRRDARLVLQTFFGEHHSVTTALSGDDKGFWEAELRLRYRFGLPPYSRFIAVYIEGADLNAVQEVAKETASAVKQIFGDEGIVIGPAPALVNRIRGDYRFQILVKTTAPIIYKKGPELTAIRQPRRKKKPAISVVVDPLDFIKKEPPETGRQE